MGCVVHESSWEWTLTEVTSLRDFKVTPSFSLLPDVDLSLFFKYRYIIIHRGPNKSDLSEFGLSLVVLQSSDISASVDFEIKMIVNYSNGHRYHGYETMKCKAAVMKEFTFDDVFSKIHQRVNGAFESTLHSKNMSSNCLVLKCCVKIKDELLKMPATASLPINFIKDFSSIYEPAVLSDVKINVGDKYLPAHKAILAAHSPVFLKMLTNNFKESLTSTITITDSNYDEFKTFLKYLYTAEIEDPSWSSIRQLYKLADKYDVLSLRSDCQRRILSLMDEDKICDILMLVYDHEDKDIKGKVVDYIVTHIKSIIPTEAWKSMVASHMHIGFDIAMKFVPE